MVLRFKKLQESASNQQSLMLFQFFINNKNNGIFSDKIITYCQWLLWDVA